MLKPYDVWGVIKHRADYFVDLGVVQRAIDEYSKYIDKHDHWMRAFYERGLCYMLRCDWISAVVDLSCVIICCASAVTNDASIDGESYINDDFDMQYCVFLMSLCYFNIGDYSKVIKLLSLYDGNTVTKYPDKVWGLRGLCYIKKNELDKAKEAFLSAITFNPDVADYHWNLGQVLCGNDYYAGCVEYDIKTAEFTPYFDKAVELNPNYKFIPKSELVENFLKVDKIFKSVNVNV